MTERSVAPPLADIIEAIEGIRRVLHRVTLEAFEQSWEKRWGVLVTLVEAWERKHYPMHLPDWGEGNQVHMHQNELQPRDLYLSIRKQTGRHLQRLLIIRHAFLR